MVLLLAHTGNILSTAQAGKTSNSRTANILGIFAWESFTANIGSITKIDDIVNGNGVFKKLGEEWFDDYWMNYGKIVITTASGKPKNITLLREYLAYRGQDVTLANPTVNKPTRKKSR